VAGADERAATGRDIIHLEIGEPDFPTPAPIMSAGQQALAAGQGHYTPAAGLPALREAIAGHYADRHLRFACTRPVSQLDEAADRLERFLSTIGAAR